MYLQAAHPDEVLEEAMPHIDLLLIQPTGNPAAKEPKDHFNAAPFDRLHQTYGKPIIIGDHQFSFATPEFPLTMWVQYPSAAEAVAAYGACPARSGGPALHRGLQPLPNPRCRTTRWNAQAGPFAAQRRAVSRLRQPDRRLQPPGVGRALQGVEAMKTEAPNLHRPRVKLPGIFLQRPRFRTVVDQCRPRHRQPGLGSHTWIPGGLPDDRDCCWENEHGRSKADRRWP